MQVFSETAYSSQTKLIGECISEHRTGYSNSAFAVAQLPILYFECPECEAIASIPYDMSFGHVEIHVSFACHSTWSRSVAHGQKTFWYVMVIFLPLGTNAYGCQSRIERI